MSQPGRVGANPDANLVSQSHVPNDPRCPHGQYLYFVGHDQPMVTNCGECNRGK